jgi:hypothetical protein
VTSARPADLRLQRFRKLDGLFVQDRQLPTRAISVSVGPLISRNGQSLLRMLNRLSASASRSEPPAEYLERSPASRRVGEHRPPRFQAGFFNLDLIRHPKCIQGLGLRRNATAV